MTEKKSQNRNSDAAFVTVLSANVVKEASRNSKFIFSLIRQPLNLKTCCACAENTDLILQAFKKYSSCDPIPLIIFAVCLMLKTEKLNVERRTHLTDGTKSAAGFHLIG
jgi:hypothetical protein